MSSPNSADFVRCLKCGKIFKCSRYDGAALLNHIRNDHPEVDIIDTDTKRKRRFHAAASISTPKSLSSQKELSFGSCRYSNGECGAEKFKQPLPGRDVNLSNYSATSEVLAKYPEIKECEYAPRNPNAQVAYIRRYKLSSPSPRSINLLQQPFQYTLYRISIEKWCPADGLIYCPNCGSNKRPLIKTKAERFTHNECGACCLLSCWPFCFIPWILPGQNQEYLYCANCKTFLGLYDRQRNCLKPNRLYLYGDLNGEQKKETELVEVKPEQALNNTPLENESPPPEGWATDSPSSTHVSSIIVNGKELSPEVVARISKYKRFGHLVGIDLTALADAPTSTNHQVAIETKTQVATPSVAKEN